MPRPKKSNRADGRYQIRRVVAYTYEGKAISKSFYGKNKVDAEEKYREYVEQIKRQEQRKKDMLFTEWAEEWLETYKRDEVKSTSYESTYLRPYRNYIEPFFKERYIRGITSANIKEFLNSVSDMSKSYRSKMRGMINAIFEAALDNDIVAKNPCRTIKVKGRDDPYKRTYDEESVEALCEKMECSYSIYVHILLRMGLRASELCGLRWADIDFRKGKMRIDHALTRDGTVLLDDDTKTLSSRRRLDIPKDLLIALNTVYTTRKANLPPSAKELVYVACRGGICLSPQHLAHRLKRFYGEAGVPEDQRLTPHELRHTCGTLLYQKTKDIYHVSRFLGHSDIGTTARVYVHTEAIEDPVHIDFGA